MSNPIFDISPFTMLDFPNKTACIIWFAGCNMRCKYCYNGEIVRGKGRIAYAEALQFLESRTLLLDGVVLSGGECLIHSDIVEFVREIKTRQFLVKIDTNGSKPKILEQLLRSNLINYVALDFKALSRKFYHITQSDLFSKFERSIDILIDSGIEFEVRTTVHSQLFEENDIQEMVLFLEQKGYKGTYYIQNYFNQTHSIGDLENDLYPVQQLKCSSKQFSISVRN